MSKKIIISFICSLLLTISTSVFGAGVDDLNIYTEEYPPYNYSENGKVTGIFSEVVDYLLKENNSKLSINDIKSVPWARGYNNCLKRPNTVLYGMTFTEERKPLFKWVGPLINSRVILFAKKSKGIKINGPEDIGKYRVGVINEDIGEQLLKNMGVPANALDGVPEMISNIKKLEADRIDMMAYGEIVGNWMIKNAGFNVEDYESVYVLKEGELFIAINKETSDTIVTALQKALDKLKNEDNAIFKSILDKYLK
jgi:polar amino acid transport system substrate-binding protein